MKANLEFLASDFMQGRESCTEYENIAAEFIASEMKKSDLGTFKENGDYFQKIPVIAKKVQPESSIIALNENGEITELKMGSDWIVQPNSFKKMDINEPLQVVFCGYGITAEEYGYDDYKDVNVEGKIVLALWGEPGNDDPEYFEGPKPTKYYGPSFKTGLARLKGAVAMLFIPDALLDQYWKYMPRMVMINSVQLADEPEDTTVNLPGAMLSTEAVKGLLANEEFEYTGLMEMISDTSFEPFMLTKKVVIDINVKRWEDEIENVIGVIEGSDPELKDEIITIGAHYDHDGTWDGVVYNGADDNASGTVAVLEVMRRLRSTSPRRTIVGILFAGEEKGLLGSKYFVKTYPEKDNIIANINIDMCGRENVDSLTSKASEETCAELYKLVQEVDDEMENMGFYYEPGVNSSQGTSDHASFAKEGIPAVYFGDKMKDDLHLPSDDANKINYDKIGRTTIVIEELIRKIDRLDNKLTIN